ncbi:hypothetical protein SLA2020_431370 [Shorea laevis]
MEPWKNWDLSESRGMEKTLYRNDYAWNNVANVIFLESQPELGFHIHTIHPTTLIPGTKAQQRTPILSL